MFSTNIFHTFLAIPIVKCVYTNMILIEIVLRSGLAVVKVDYYESILSLECSIVKSGGIYYFILYPVCNTFISLPVFIWNTNLSHMAVLYIKAILGLQRTQTLWRALSYILCSVWPMVLNIRRQEFLFNIWEMEEGRKGMPVGEYK